MDTSAGVMQSALANTGTILTFPCRAFIHSTSRGRRLQHKQTCVNLSPVVTAPEGLRSQRTRGWTGRWSTGSSGLCCLGCSSCSSRSHLLNTAQTAGRCSPLCFASWWSNIGSLWVQQTGEATVYRNYLVSQLSWLNYGHRQTWDIWMGPPFCVVYCVSKPRRVYDVQPQSDSFLLNADCVFDDVDRLADSV